MNTRLHDFPASAQPFGGSANTSIGKPKPLILCAHGRGTARQVAKKTLFELRLARALALLTAIRRSIHSSTVILLGCGGLNVLLVAACAFAGDSSTDLSISRWLTISGNFDGGYRKTQFFTNNHNAAVGQWDTRLEMWLPPFREEFSFGPYLRFAGIAASRDPAWENALLAGPGGGFQVYPFSLAQFRKPDSFVGKLLGPLRLYGEYNRLDYLGRENSWRPDEQIRAGAEYWRARHVNETSWPWWTEFWTGLQWQSANEFDRHYDSVVFANAFRAGARIPKAGFLSAITPYAALESSLTENKTYHWENRLLFGGRTASGSVADTPTRQHEMA